MIKGFSKKRKWYNQMPKNYHNGFSYDKYRPNAFPYPEENLKSFDPSSDICFTCEEKVKYNVASMDEFVEDLKWDLYVSTDNLSEYLEADKNYAEFFNCPKCGDFFVINKHNKVIDSYRLNKIMYTIGMNIPF